MYVLLELILCLLGAWKHRLRNSNIINLLWELELCSSTSMSKISGNHTQICNFFSVITRAITPSNLSNLVVRHYTSCITCSLSSPWQNQKVEISHQQTRALHKEKC